MYKKWIISPVCVLGLQTQHYIRLVHNLIITAIPEDALNDESNDDEDKENPDERISSKSNDLNIFYCQIYTIGWKFYNL